MKKSLLALAVLGTMAGAASAQSSVTLFGVVDLAAKYVKNDGFENRKSLDHSGLNTSRLGFRGVEDLGGGLKAGFWLEGAIQPDDGTSGKLDFRRRSTLSLMGGFGEVRLGRDYTPTFWNTTIFDPFGTNGVGSSLNVSRFANSQLLGGLAPTFVRADNSIGYFLPSGIGGLYGQAMVAANEGKAGNVGKYSGARIGWAAGPFDVAAAYGQQKLNAGDFKSWNIAGSWDFGLAKVMAQFNDEKTTDQTLLQGGNVEERRYLLGAVVPLGQGEVHASYNHNDLRNSDADANMLALGYVYNLSKRTAIYGQGARISNKGNTATGANFSVAYDPVGTTLGSSPGGPTRGGKSNGFELGIRHFF